MPIKKDKTEKTLRKSADTALIIYSEETVDGYTYKLDEDSKQQLLDIFLSYGVTPEFIESFTSLMDDDLISALCLIDPSVATQMSEEGLKANIISDITDDGTRH